jgi:hypothetical protein
MVVLAFVSAIPVVLLIGFIMGDHFDDEWEDRETTVSRLSPDETILARLIEASATRSLVRHFKVRLQALRSDSRGFDNIFRSSEGGDAGQPGTERLIWSKDGTKLLLVGRHFFVKDDLFLDNGDQAFFLYDVPTRRGWCNSEAPAGLPALTPQMIEGVEFTEPVRLKPR